MPGKTSFRLLVLAALFTLLIPLAGTTPGAAADGDDNQFTIPEKAELKYPNLGSMLNQMVARVEEEGATAEDAAGDAPVHRAESVAVTIYLSGNVDGVVQFLEDFGGDPRNVGEDYIEAYVPVSLLGPVSEQPGVLRVREIVPPQPDFGDVTSQGVQAHLSAAWNQAGYSGQGVKVGIIDLGFKDLTSLMGTELPARVQGRCYTDIGVFTQDLADCEAVDEVTVAIPECLDDAQRRAVRSAIHGTVVAESLIDIAPEVSLYIANPISRADLQAAADWMASEGVSVINYSVVWIFDGPGDGTSPFSASPLNTVDRAVASDILWVNAAGNGAQETWFGGYSDPDGDGAISFDGRNDEVIDMPVRACRRSTVQLRWEDNWDGASTDLDLYLYDKRSGILFPLSVGEQSGRGGHVPFEAFSVRPRIDSDDFGIVVVHYGGDAPGWIQLVVWQVDPIQPHTGSGSVNNPAESANPGMLAVGAAPWLDTDTIEYYSSRGPTPDGRVKPDIVGADCGETALAPLNENRRGFCGTSQAAPHVAGMAALVQQRFPGYTPAQVAAYLKDHAQQRVTPDPNNTWGHGFAQLPSPDRAALVALYNATGGANWTNNDGWLTNVPISQWDGVTTDGSGRVTELNLTRNQLKGEIPTELGSLANLELLALGGNQLTGCIPHGLQDVANNDFPDLGLPFCPADPCLEPLGPLTAPVTGRAAWSGDCASEGQANNYARYYTFTLSEETRVAIYLTSSRDTYLYLREGEGKTGTVVQENNNVGRGSINSRIEETLPMGTYTVEATTYYRRGVTGDFTLDIRPVTCVQQLGTLTETHTTPGTWSDDCVSARQTGNYHRSYSFTLGAPTDLRIDLTSERDTYLYLLREDGTVLDQNNNVGRGNINSRIIQTALAAGTYTVEATTYYRNPVTGNFVLNIGLTR